MFTAEFNTKGRSLTRFRTRLSIALFFLSFVISLKNSNAKPKYSIANKICKSDYGKSLPQASKYFTSAQKSLWSEILTRCSQLTASLHKTYEVDDIHPESSFAVGRIRAQKRGWNSQQWVSIAPKASKGDPLYQCTALGVLIYITDTRSGNHHVGSTQLKDTGSLVETVVPDADRNTITYSFTTDYPIDFDFSKLEKLSIYKRIRLYGARHSTVNFTANIALASESNVITMTKHMKRVQLESSAVPGGHQECFNLDITSWIKSTWNHSESPLRLNVVISYTCELSDTPCLDIFLDRAFVIYDETRAYFPQL